MGLTLCLGASMACWMGRYQALPKWWLLPVTRASPMAANRTDLPGAADDHLGLAFDQSEA
jgi:hypothetical protein